MTEYFAVAVFVVHVMKRALVQLIWGFPQSFIGLCVWTWLKLKGEHETARLKYRTGSFLIHQDKLNVSFGLFVFSDGRWDRDRHELGHAIQSLYLGPFYLIVIGIPSVCWLYFRRVACPSVPYRSFFTERWADSLGKDL